MILKALKFLQTELDLSIRRRFMLNEGSTVLSRLVDADGSTPLQNQNKLVLSLINLEQNNNQPYNNWNQVDEHNRSLVKSPPLRFDIDLMMSACFDDYEESLKFLNAGIAFFQAAGTFEPNAYPTMPEGIEKLQLIIETLDHKDTHSLWSALGAKYMPSIIYKVKMIEIDVDVIRSEEAMGQGFTTDVRN